MGKPKNAWIIGAAFAVACIFAAAVSGCNSGPKLGVKLQACKFSTTTDLSFVPIASMLSGTVAFIVAPPATAAATTPYQIVLYQAGAKDLREAARFDAGYFLPVCVLDRSQMVVEDLGPWISFIFSAGGLSGHRYRLINKDTAEKRDVTPNRLIALPSLFPCVTTRYMPLYTKRGFTFLTRNGDVASMWQGAEQLSRTQRVTGVVCIGRTFNKGKLCDFVITSDRKAWIYDDGTGKLEYASEYQDVASTVASMLPQSQVVLAQHIAVWVSNDFTELILADDKGNADRLPLEDLTDEDIDLNQAADVMVEKLMASLEKKKEEGKRAPPYKISMFCQLIPLDENRIAVLDLIYQRVVIVSPKK